MFQKPDDILSTSGQDRFLGTVKALLLFFLLSVGLECILPGIITYSLPFGILLLFIGIVNLPLIILSLRRKSTGAFSGWMLSIIFLLFFITILKGRTLFPYAPIVAVLAVGLAVGFFVVFFQSELGSQRLRLPRVTRYHLIVLTFGLAIWGFCAYRYLTPSGILTQQYSPTDVPRSLTVSSDQATPVVPVKTKEPYALWPQATAVTSAVPRAFQDVTIELEYSELGEPSPVTVKTSNALGWTSESALVDYDRDLENLPPYWQRTERGDYVLWQRNSVMQQQFDANQVMTQGQLAALSAQKSDQEDALKEQWATGIISRTDFVQRSQDLETAFQQQQNDLIELAPAPEGPTPANSATMDDFLQSPNKSFRKIVTVNASLENAFSLSLEDIEPYQRPLNEALGIRGNFSLGLYQPSDGPFQLSLSLQDTNASDGFDPVQLTLSRAGQLVTKSNLPDDGITVGSGVQTGPTALVIAMDNLPHGLYSVDLSATPDVLTDTIHSTTSLVAFNQRFLSFTNPEFSSNNPSLNLYTNSSSVRILREVESSPSTVTINATSYSLPEVGAWLSLKNLPERSAISFPAGGVVVTGDGVFTTDEQSPLLNYFEKTKTDISQIDIDGADYIYARYRRPRVIDGKQVVSLTLSAPVIGFSNNSTELEFVFDRPSGSAYRAKVYSFTLTYHKPRLTPTVFLNKLLTKIRAAL